MTSIKTDRLHIRHITESDWQAVREIWQDFSLSKYAQYDMPHSTDEAGVRARIEKWVAHQGSEHMFFAVCLDAVVIGYIAFNHRDDGYEIGYCFHSLYHGKGYARESLSALIEHMRGLGATRFSAGTAIANQPSVRLLLSLGFKRIGEERVSFYQDEEGNAVYFEGGIFELDMADSRDCV